MRSVRAGLLGWAFACLAQVAAAASSTPMRLDDPTPRWVAVEFEISPTERPGQLGTVYTQKLPGWLEPDVHPGRMRLTTPAWAIERGLMAAERPVPGSFSDFVWIFEAQSGRVVEARLSGTVVREIEVGFFSQEVEARIEVQMSSDEFAGYGDTISVLGQRVVPYCEGRTSSCHTVDAHPYDPGTGDVNAVGRISATAVGVQTVSFSPLGEARFSEIEGAPWVRMAGSSSVASRSP